MCVCGVLGCFYQKHHSQVLDELCGYEKNVQISDWCGCEGGRSIKFKFETFALIAI